MTSESALAGKRVWVAGHAGMVGAALMRRLGSESCELLTATRAELDLLDRASVDRWLAIQRPDFVLLAAAKVGGISDNRAHPATYLHQNLVIQSNVIDGAFRADVGRLVFVSSSCAYPRLAEQPIHENALLTGPLEPTMEAYALAKIAGVKQCAYYRQQYGVEYFSVMLANLFGPGDNFDLATTHVMPALIRKAHEAKLDNSRPLVLMGTGSAIREFMFVDDCADAIVHLASRSVQHDYVNVGSGEEMSILEAATRIGKVVGYDGEIRLDRSKPDGTPRKVLDTGRLRSSGWRPMTSFEAGVAQTYRWFLSNGAP